MKPLMTTPGSEVAFADFESWNEQMFARYGNDRLYYHPNLLIRLIQLRRISAILTFLNVQTSDAVLDAGCGEGFLFSRLPGSIRRVGVDLSIRAVEIAAQRNSGVEWIRADAHKMPFDSEAFDKVCCSEVIEHVVHPEGVIQELHRIVKPSGSVVITIPNERAINRAKDLILSSRLGRMVFPRIPFRTEWHLTEYTPALLRSQVRSCFNIQREKVLPIMGLGIGYIILCTPK